VSRPQTNGATVFSPRGLPDEVLTGCARPSWRPHLGAPRRQHDGL